MNVLSTGKLLCIGGPADGQWHRPDPTRHITRLRIAQPMARTGPLYEGEFPPFEKENIGHYWTGHATDPGGVHEVLIAEGLSYHDAMGLLIANYRPKRAG